MFHSYFFNLHQAVKLALGNTGVWEVFFWCDWIIKHVVDMRFCI